MRLDFIQLRRQIPGAASEIEGSLQQAQLR
jgi:hypothetical protein